MSSISNYKAEIMYPRFVETNCIQSFVNDAHSTYKCIQDFLIILKHSHQTYYTILNTGMFKHI